MSSASRRPRPSCCRNTVALSVGRRNKTASTVARSTPSIEEIHGEDEVHLRPTVIPRVDLLERGDTVATSFASRSRTGPYRRARRNTGSARGVRDRARPRSRSSAAMRASNHPRMDFPSALSRVAVSLQQDLHPKAIEQGAIRWRLGVAVAPMALRGMPCRGARRSLYIYGRAK